MHSEEISKVNKREDRKCISNNFFFVYIRCLRQLNYTNSSIILWIIKTFITKIYNSGVKDNTYFYSRQSIRSYNLLVKPDA